MKKINLKKEKGSVTSIVLVTVLFFAITLSSAYMLVISSSRTQLKSELLLKNLYESQIEQANSIANELLK